MDEIYETYRGHVTAIRASRLKKPLDELTGGRVFTGAQAFELGLIDKIGTLDDAIVHVADQTGLSDYDVRVVPRANNFIEVLMERSGDDEADRKGLDVAAGRQLLPAAGSLPLFELAAP
jgi:protease-4